MRLVFRVDASQDIGAGHVMRCSAIIEEAMSRNIECIVVGSMGGIEWLERRLMQLGTTHVEDWKNFEFSKVTDVLVIDSYKISMTDCFIQPGKWKSVVNIADEETPNYTSNLVIHPGIDSITEKQSGVRILTGPDFIPLRKSIKKSEIFNSSEVKKVVVFGGGSDKFHLASAIANELIEIQLFETAVFFTDLKQEISMLDSRFQISDFGAALDDVLADTDLVFTTASTSSLEIIAREIPLAVCSSVSNQGPYLRALSEKSLAIGVGSLNSSGSWNLDSALIRELFNDPNLRYQLRKNSSGFLDLLGSQRIVNELQCL